ncbi:hypothetical protein E2I00_007265, partial [Balaenoptera physalus]
HYLRSLEEARTPTPVHYRPHGVKFKINPKNGQRERLSKRVKKVWKPQLFQRELYSEILDTRFTVTVTMRTLDLIDEAYGASCQTPKEDLCSKFGMDLKRGMLLRLARQDPQLHPDDPDRRVAIYDKYKDPVPLFKVYVEELIEQLQQQALSEPAVVQKRASRT